MRNTIRISTPPPEVNERSKRKVLRDAGVTLFLGLVFLFCLVVLFGNQGLVALSQTAARHREVQQELQSIRKENEELRQTVKTLETDPQAVEGLARGELRLAKPGEEVYFFTEESQNSGR
jgi:cell division protein FtsB